MVMERKGEFHRKTSETDITVAVNLDGTGAVALATPVPFFDHMLDLLAKHSGVDIFVQAAGDVQIDDHHLIEDMGICLGEAVKAALGDRAGINRYGSVAIPMDEALCRAVIDISGRPYLVYHAPLDETRIGSFDASLLEEFFKAFTDHGAITLHISVLYGKNTHHIAEAVFKAFAHAFKEAVTFNQAPGVLSTKGHLD
jgi:imidazoleglycerol-phosphate dehydratase